MQKTRKPLKPALLLIVVLAFSISSCSRNKMGMLAEVQGKYSNSSYYNQIDESMIRAAANMDTSGGLKNIDQYIEQVLSFQIDRNLSLYDSAWMNNFMKNIDFEKYESLIEFENDSLQLNLFMLKGSDKPEVLDLIISSKKEVRIIEIKGDQPMGITNAIFKTAQSGENPLEALSQFGL